MSTVEQSVLQMVMVPAIRQIAFGYFQEWMFTSELSKAIYKTLKGTRQPDLPPDARDVVMTMHNDHGVSEDDCAIAYQLILEAEERGKTYNLENYVHHITEFIRDRTMGRGVELVATAAEKPGNKVRGQQLLQEALSFTISTDQFYDFSDLSEIVTAKEMDFPPGGVIIKSHFNLVNRCSLYKGYKYGDLIAFMGRPGGGKSTGLVDEGAYAVHQGFKVCHIFLGDMSEYDAFLKYLSYWTGATTNEIIANGHEQYLTPEIVDMFRRLRVKAFPADTFDIYQLMAKINQLRTVFGFDMVVVDYDANIKPSTDNMYGEGGSTYANLKSYGQNRCVVLVGSQTKNAFWDHEVVPIEAPAESSKKAHHVDMLIGIGRSKACPKVGTLNIPKMRRGESEVQVRLHLDYASTRLKEISQETYNQMVAEHQAKSLAQSEEGLPPPEGEANPGYAAPS
jgi:replicative DNA helicase